MTDQELERRLAKAVEHAAPNDLEGVLSRCDERKGTVISMKKVKNKGKRWLAVAACLALLLVGGGGGVLWQQAAAVSTVVSLDVNPSIELDVNKNGKVVECQALNSEGEEVLSEMNGGKDLKSTTLDVAANALVGALVRHGYLSSVSSAILISVEDQDTQRAVAIQQELTDVVDSILRTQAPTAAVMSQTVTRDEDVEKLARENHISAGKAVLVNQVLEKNPKLDFGRLSALTVEELRDLSKMEKPEMPIGCQAALEAALKYAGVAADYQVDADVDPELNDTPACYEVELYHHSLGEIEYEVDAFTGAILEGRKDALKGLPGNPNRISEQKAVAAALAQAGVKTADAADVSAEVDQENGRIVWEVEFTAGGTEYECLVDAVSGKVLNVDKEALSEDEDDDRDDADEDEDDEDDNEAAVAPDVGNRIKTAVLKHAGVAESQVKQLLLDYDHEDGRQIVEVEFTANGFEYEYQVAPDGTILDFEKEAED